MVYANLLKKILQSSIDALEEITVEEYTAKISPEKWSKQEIIGHLIDSAYNNHLRFIKAKSQGNLIFLGYNQDEWVKINNYQNRSKLDIIDTWITVNQHIGKLFNNLNADVYNKQTIEHNFHKICMNLLEEGESASLSYLMWDYLFHIEHHLSQVISNYKRLTTTFVQMQTLN